MKQTITAFGHPNVLAKHPTTIEITTHEDLTSAGDCIIAVLATRGCASLSPELKNEIKSGKKIKVTLSAGGVEDVVTGVGHPGLLLSHKDDIVVRTSDFKCPRTLMINADKAAADLNPALIQKLKDPKTQLSFTIETI